VNDTTISVSWSTPATVTDVASYIVDICDGGAYDISYNISSSPRTLSGLQASTTYSISITMVDSAGNLSKAAVVTATTQPPTATNPTPTNPTPTNPTPTNPTPTNPTPTNPTPPTNNVPCFVAGTLIRTPAGEKAVELLRNGDIVVTADGRSVPVKVYSTTLNKTTKGTAPYLVPAHAFGRNSPPADIRLSPLHAFQIKKGLWMNSLYANNKAVQQYAVGEAITYYHVECPNFFRDNLLANGCVVESFAGRQVANPKNIYTFNSRLGGFTRATGVTKTVAK
jgi:Hint domain/Fibronectin type III domain